METALNRRKRRMTGRNQSSHPVTPLIPPVVPRALMRTSVNPSHPPYPHQIPAEDQTFRPKETSGTDTEMLQSTQRLRCHQDADGISQRGRRTCQYPYRRRDDRRRTRAVASPCSSKRRCVAGSGAVAGVPKEGAAASSHHRYDGERHHECSNCGS